MLLKDEGQRFGTGALKILGASYAVHHFTQSEPVIGICTATDGNHGRAVAWAAKHKGYKSVVFVPHFTKPGRIKAIEREGGKVIVSAGDYDTAVKEAAYFAREKISNSFRIQPGKNTSMYRQPLLLAITPKCRNF